MFSRKETPRGLWGLRRDRPSGADLEKLQLLSPKGELDHWRKNPERRRLRVSGRGRRPRDEYPLRCTKSGFSGRRTWECLRLKKS